MVENNKRAINLIVNELETIINKTPGIWDTLFDIATEFMRSSIGYKNSKLYIYIYQFARS